MDSVLLNMSLYFSLVPCIFFILKWFLNSPSNPTKKLPPSPPNKLPIIGHIHKLGSLPHRSLHTLSQKYGPFILLHFGTKPVLVISSPDGAREIMKTHDSVFANRPKSGVVRAILRGKKDVAFSDYDENWRQVRSICVVQLLSNKMVQSFRNIREEETSEMVKKINNISGSGVQVNLSEMFVTLTNDVIFRATLGGKYGDGKVVEMILGFAELIGVFNIADYIPLLSWVNRFNGLDAKVEKVTKDFHEFMDNVIQEHRSNYDGNSSEKRTASNFLDILLQIQRDNNANISSSISNPLVEDDAIKAIIIDMFAGGTDTTHTLMDWVMVELLRHSKTMQKLQTEVRQVVRGKPELTEDDLQTMPYLKAVIKETLRLHCPVPLLVPHESSQDRKIMGYDVAAGTQAIINGWAIGRDPSVWPNPEEFQPERFLINSEIDYQGFHFQLIPFGAGRRGCPGTNFAVVLNELALAKLMHKFDFALPDGVKAENMNMEEQTGINIKRKAPLLVMATPNSSQ